MDTDFAADDPSRLLADPVPATGETAAAGGLTSWADHPGRPV